MSDVMKDLIERMNGAAQVLTTMAETESPNATRLRDKAEGVRLCLSYAHEALFTETT